MLDLFPVRRIARHFRRAGPRSAWKKYRWRFAAVVFVYYLVRDLILYVALPIMAVSIARG